MNNKEIIDKIKTEIERRIKEYDTIIESQPESNRAERDAWKWAECKSLLSFLDTLQVEELPAGLDEKPRKRLRKVCNWIEEAKYETEHQEKLLEERLQELHKIRAEKNLDEAAEEYSKSVSDGHCYRDLQCGFKAGAEWMAGQGWSRELEVKEDAGGYPYIDKHIELYDYDTDEPLAKKGDKVVVKIRKK